MPNQYLVVERVGKGCTQGTDGRLEHWDLPDAWGFAKEEDARQLCLGDRLVSYVAPNWGFAVDMEVGSWQNGSTYKLVEDAHPEWPFRVKVEVLGCLRDRHLMPKWKDFWSELRWCRGMNAKSAAQTLRRPLRAIVDKHDYELISRAIHRAASK